MEIHLPSVPLMKIFSYLDAYSLLQAAQVNKDWNELASSDVLWRSSGTSMLYLRAWLNKKRTRQASRLYGDFCEQDFYLGYSGGCFDLGKPSTASRYQAVDYPP
uniref:F-box and WD-40 domain protein 13 n=1 Tax=Mus musculus TaxID=10090 RepID=A0A0G2JFH5_MOUSE